VGSTWLVQHLGEHYPAVLAEHHRLLRDAFQSCGGQVFTFQLGEPGDQPVPANYNYSFGL
jgi:hypothetical protein